MGPSRAAEAIAFASGMAAAAAVVERAAGGRASPSHPRRHAAALSLLFAEQVRLGRMTVHEVDMTDTTATVAALTGADLIWVESPTNPAARYCGPAPDRRSRACRRRHGLRRLDVQYPLVARPLDLGADVVMHAATKALAGHSDLLMGVLVTRSPERAEALRTRRIRTGAMPGGLECFLALRAAHAGRADGARAGQRHKARHPAQRAPAGLPGPLPRSAVRPVSRAGVAAASGLRDGDLVRGRRAGRRLPRRCASGCS